MNILELIIGTLCDVYYLVLSVAGGGSFPPRLTAQEEAQYIDQLSKGDMQARKKLIEHNLRLVAHVTRKYVTQTADNDDMVSIGTIGLIKAVDSFRADKGTRFSSYAARCIEKATPSLRLYIVLKMKNESLFLKNGVYSKNRIQTATFA